MAMNNNHKRVLFLQNGESDGPGIFAQSLHECGVEMTTVHAWRNEPMPALDGFDGVAVGGGGMSVYEADRYPFLSEEIALLRAAREAHKPVLGMCLGAQLMAAAYGGRVFPNASKEIGFYEVRFSEAAHSDRLWQDCAMPFQPVHWHGDTVSLPPDATLLASSDLTRNQLFRLDESLYGIQFHLEFDVPLLTKMIRDDGPYLAANGVDPDILLRTAAKVLPTVAPIAQTVFGRWVQLFYPASPCAKTTN